MDLSHNTALRHLNLCGVYGRTETKPGEMDEDEGWNKLTQLDVSMLPELNYLSCNYMPLDQLDVSANKELEYLFCYCCYLPKVDVTQNTKLLELECSLNDLGSLDVSNCPNLRLLECSTNELTELDVSKNRALAWVYVLENPISELDLSCNPEIVEFGCDPGVYVENGTHKLYDGEFRWEEKDVATCGPNGEHAQIEDGYLIFYGPFTLEMYDENGSYKTEFRFDRELTAYPLAPDVEYRVNAFEGTAEMINSELKSDHSRKYLHINMKDGMITRLASMCGDW